MRSIWVQAAGSRDCRQLVAVVVLVISTVAVVFASSVPAAISGNTGQQRPSDGHLERKLGRLCRQITTMKRISQMEKLIDLLKQSEARLDFQTNVNKHLSRSSIWRLTGADSTATCHDQADAIVDLEAILKERRHVCKSGHIDKIEAYYRRYLMARSSNNNNNNPYSPTVHISGLSGQPKVTSKFFSLYANQVAFLCKSHLLRSLRVADHELIKPEEYDRVIPWLKSTNKRECQSFKTSDSLDIKRIHQCNAREILGDIKSIQELTEAMRSINETSTTTTTTAPAAAAAAYRQPPGEPKVEEGIFLVTPSEERPFVEGMLESCAKFQLVYSQTVTPIVRLIEMGFDPDFDNFNKICNENEFLQRWFSITLICSSLLTSRLGNDKYHELQESLNKSLIIVDDLEEAAGDQSSLFKLNQESGQPTGTTNQSTMFDIEIEDELWVSKYAPTGLNKFRNNFVKGINRVLKLDSVEDQILYRKRLSDAKRHVINIILASLALFGLNSIH